LGILLNPLILLLFANRAIGLKDLEEIDSSFYKGLKWVEENDVSGADLTFSVAYEMFGDTVTVDLIDDGRNVTVTEENKHEYISLMIEYITRGRFEPAVTSLLEGFNRHIPSSYLTHFTQHELKVLISGQVSIDVNDLLKNIEFSGTFSPDSAHLQWLCQVLESFDQEMLVKFLVFVSGCPCLPVDGLNPSLMLTSIDGNDSVLPRAHTCFNQLVLPQYSSMRILEEKLLFALNNSNDGFHIS
jgi:E3 ubiquitin-protein ligase HUWE1